MTITAPRSTHLADELADDLRRARRQSLAEALDRLEDAIEQLYPSERYDALIDEEHDW